MSGAKYSYISATEMSWITARVGEVFIVPFVEFSIWGGEEYSKN